MTDPALERRRADAGAAIDAVTISFGEQDAGVCGWARLEIGGGEPALLGAAAALCDGERVVVDTAATVSEADASWDALAAGGLAHEVVEPLRAWRVRMDHASGGFALDVEAITEPFELAAGELAGYAQVCRLRGTVVVAGKARELDCRGERRHVWAAQGPDRSGSRRGLAVWLGEDAALGLLAERPRKAKGHEAEEVAGYFVGEDVPVALDEARISTTYDGAGRERRIGLELWESEDAPYPRRAAGEPIAATTLELDGTRVGCTFLRWRLDSREGVGVYETASAA